MLLLILARLRCFRAAVQTSVLSRRWRGLWIGLTDLTFRGLGPAKIEALLRRLAASPEVVSTLDISLSWTQDTASVNSLLRAAFRLSPEQLVFAFKQTHIAYHGHIELPCFRDTTSIELDTGYGTMKPPAGGGEFAALQSLSIAGNIIDLGSLLNRCPSLRTLSVTCPNKHFLRIILPPACEFPTLEKLSLSASTTIVDVCSLLACCQRLRVLSVTQLSTCPLRITPPPSGEFSMLEKLSLSGNIVDLGLLLNQCPRLRVLGVTFRGALDLLKAGLTALREAAPLGLLLSPLGIGIPWVDDNIKAACFASLLRAAARLSPKELVLTNNFEGCTSKKMFFDRNIKADLRCFPNTTSIEMSLSGVCFTPLPTGEFSALERLSFSPKCGIIDIGTLVTRCPRLRLLKVTIAVMGKIMVHSASLQKLDVSTLDDTDCQGIDIVTPLLKELHLVVRARMNVDVSISAPVVENVLWQRSYTAAMPFVFGSWRLWNMIVQTTHTCWQQLPQFVLCLSLNAGNQRDAELNFAQEMEKLPVTNFSTLKLHFAPGWHVYGALASQLLRMCRIRAATKKLMVVQPSWPEARRACPSNCPCDNPKNWRSQRIIYTGLEEVEMQGFNGEEHEHDFLRLILKCSPMLRSVVVRPSMNIGGCTTELSNIFMAHRSVKYYWYPGEAAPRAYV